jgi:hypothetical protein
MLATVRALRHPIAAPYRRTPRVVWRGVTCSVIEDSGVWLRIRMVRPDPDDVARIGATCVERGLYEAWAPTAEVAGHDDLVIRYG